MMERSGQVVVREGAALAQACAEWIASAMAGAIAERGRCDIALSGGSSPRPVYLALSVKPLWSAVDWSRVHVHFGDERAVPPEDAESNYRMVSGTLLCRVPIPHTQVHRMEAERSDLDSAAADYERLLPAALDVLLLGIGPDGHTASLFPGSPALLERSRRVMAVIGPKPPPRRLTITPPVIEAARAIAVIATGAEKASVVAAAVAGSASAQETPARLARRGTWFLDPAAASQLEIPA